MLGSRDVSARLLLILGILLLGWVFLIGCVGPLSGLMGSLVEGAAERAASEITPFILNLIVSIVLLFVFLFFQMVFDYARITTVVQERHNVLRAALEGFRFVFRHPGATLGLFGLLTVVQAGAPAGDPVHRQTGIECGDGRGRSDAWVSLIHHLG